MDYSLQFIRSVFQEWTSKQASKHTHFPNHPTTPCTLVMDFQKSCSYQQPINFMLRACLFFRITSWKLSLFSPLINAEMLVISNSNFLLFLFLGDILGLAMQNLENLLQMPYGCGEQNIALLASDTYVLDYLQSTQQLTEEIKSKAFSFLSNGEMIKYVLLIINETNCH